MCERPLSKSELLPVEGFLVVFLVLEESGLLVQQGLRVGADVSEGDVVVLLHPAVSSVDLVADPDVIRHDAGQLRFLLRKPALCLRELMGEAVYLVSPLSARVRSIVGPLLEISERFS